MIPVNFDTFLFPENESEPIRAAIFVAMAESLEDEKEVINFFKNKGIDCVATMITGPDSKALKNAVGHVIGACLNSNIIERKKEHVHPLGHAIEEAIAGTRLDSSLGQNCRFKVAIARKCNRIAVAMYGDLGFHEVSSHKTIGAGYQILGN